MQPSGRMLVAKKLFKKKKMTQNIVFTIGLQIKILNGTVGHS